MIQFFGFQADFLTIPVYANKNSNDFLVFDSQINLSDEFALTGLIPGRIFMVFARKTNEDEYISRIRLESLPWAVIVNYSLLLIATWMIHGFSYLHVMIYNMRTILLIFLIRFHIVLARERQATAS